MTKRNDIIINAMEDVLKEKEEKKKEEPIEEAESESEEVVESPEDIRSGPLHYIGNEDEETYEDISEEELQKQKEDSSKLSVKEESKDSDYNPLEVVDLEVDTILPDGFKIEPAEEDSSDNE